jgi:DNA repair photolyase
VRFGAVSRAMMGLLGIEVILVMTPCYLSWTREDVKRVVVDASATRARTARRALSDPAKTACPSALTPWSWERMTGG